MLSMPPGSDSIPSCYCLHASLPTSLPQHGAQLGLEVRDSIQPYRWPLGLGSAGSKACLVRALFERYLLQISSGHHSLFFFEPDSEPFCAVPPYRMCILGLDCHGHILDTHASRRCARATRALRIPHARVAGVRVQAIKRVVANDGHGEEEEA